MGKSNAKKSGIKGLLVGVTLVALIACNLGVAYAEEPLTAINDLILKSAEFDGKIVHIKGEALLETLEQRDGNWVNINDGTNAIGVFTTPEITNQIQYYGDYHTTGDTIELIGEFHRACKVHGGDLEVHLTKLVQIQKGKPVNHVIDLSKVFVAIVLLTVASTLGWYYRKNK